MTDLAPTLAALAALFVALALGGYVRFVFIRANAGALFDLEFSPLARIDEGPVGDLSCFVTNLSSNLMVVTGVRVRVRYTTKDDHGAFDKDPLEPATSGWLGPLDEKWHVPWLRIYPQTEVDRIEEAASGRTVVFQGGTQAYRKPLVFPGGTRIVTVWGSCDYHVHVGGITRWLVLRVLRPPEGLDFTLGVRNHQVRRTFRLTEESH